MKEPAKDSELLPPSSPPSSSSLSSSVFLERGECAMVYTRQFFTAKQFLSLTNYPRRNVPPRKFNALVSATRKLEAWARRPTPDAAARRPTPRRRWGARELAASSSSNLQHLLHRDNPRVHATLNFNFFSPRLQTLKLISLRTREYRRSALYM